MPVEIFLLICSLIWSYNFFVLIFFSRMCYSSFLHRYGLIIRNSSSKNLDVENERDDETVFDPLDALLKRQLDMPDSPRKTPRKRLRRRAGKRTCT